MIYERLVSSQSNKNNNKILNMCKRYQQLLAILSYIHILNAVSIYVTPSSLPAAAVAVGAAAASSSSFSTTAASTSVKPSTLLLPSGFDSQLPPRQPMLYPFVVSSSQPTPTIRKSIGPFMTPGWIPISSSNANAIAHEMPSLPSSPTTSTPTTQPYPVPVPILEDRISKYALANNDNGPVFESIVYGTWKPDPPLQPVEIVKATTTAQYGTSTGSNSSVSDSALDGKYSNKTINRQHGGFIDNKQQKTTEKFENDSHEKLSLVKQMSNESLDNIEEQKPRIAIKFVKKQGRQKIRPNSTRPKSTTTTSTASATTTTTSTKTTLTMGTPATHQFPFTLESTEQSATIRDVTKVNVNAPVEVVRQINDSIEIKYNHKQTSGHSIELAELEHYDEHHHHNHHHRHRHRHNHRPDDDDQVEQQTKKPPIPSTSTELQQEDDDDELGNSSVIRMNWPTDFMDTPLSSSTSTSTELPSDSDSAASSQLTTSQSLDSVESTELPLALSALNIPPSLWPKLPGNITKLGSPYAAENSLEEPAICVPITVREFNMMNSHEVVNIERVFCFPMPSDSNAARESLKPSSSTRSSGNRAHARSTASPPIKATVQNYEEYFEAHAKNTSNILRSRLYLLCYVVVFCFKFSIY